VLILALDTTSTAGSLAIVRDGELVHEIIGDPARTHGERLPLEFKRVCDQAQVSLRDVELLAVAAGPGSFTGLRVGIAAIQGLAVAFGRRVVPVSTLESVAFAASADVDDIAAWVDAQRGEVFAQVFGRGDARTDPISASPEAVIERWREDLPLEKIAFHGDGAVRYADRIRALIGPDAKVASAAAPLAGAIGRIAAAVPHRAVSPHAIVPIYVRRPDAELARARPQTGS
jgi:tRNA threonylcarbamoyladenosine biosynthesis protein TsaB